MRCCRTCKIEKLESEYSVNKHIKDGLSTECKECSRTKYKAAYAADPERGRQRARAFREKCPEAAKEAVDKYRAKTADGSAALRRFIRTLEKKDITRDQIKEEKRLFLERFRSDEDFRNTKISEAPKNSKTQRKVAKKIRRKAWESENIDSRRTYHRNYARHKRATDPEFRQRDLERKAMWRLKNWQKLVESEGWVKNVPSQHIRLPQFRALMGWQQNHCYFCNHVMNSDAHGRTIEHILPRSKGGPDLTQNIVLTCGNCNYSRKDKIYHIDWEPNREFLPIEDKMFLKQRTIGAKLAEHGIEYSTGINGEWIIKGCNGAERSLFIQSTFFASSRNVASNGGRMAKELQKRYDNPIILLDKEWYERTDACINMLKSKLGMSARGPGARKLEVIDISQQAANLFLDGHHVMGKKDKVGIRLGLTDGSELYGVALFSDKGDNFEWDRLALRGHIPGGMSKLLKALWNSYGYKPVRSFVDSRYADGGGHETIGFQHVGYSPEAYYWVFPDKIRHQRYLSNDNKMSSNLLYFNYDVPTADSIKANGVFKIWAPKKHIILIER